MMKSKHDLSFNHVKLDYKALHDTAVIAFIQVRNELSRKLEETYYYDFNVSYLRTETIESLASQLNTVTETLCAIKGMQEREELEIINKEIVKKPLAF